VELLFFRGDAVNVLESNVVVEVTKVRVLPDGRMTRKDASTYLGYQSKTLAMWQLEGKGPEPHRVGGRVFYFKDDLDAFIAGE
jgi:hypothetical protein